MQDPAWVRHAPTSPGPRALAPIDVAILVWDGTATIPGDLPSAPSSSKRAARTRLGVWDHPCHGLTSFPVAAEGAQLRPDPSARDRRVMLPRPLHAARRVVAARRYPSQRGNVADEAQELRKLPPAAERRHVLSGSRLKTHDPAGARSGLSNVHQWCGSRRQRRACPGRRRSSPSGATASRPPSQITDVRGGLGGGGGVVWVLFSFLFAGGGGALGGNWPATALTPSGAGSPERRATRRPYPLWHLPADLARRDSTHKTRLGQPLALRSGCVTEPEPAAGWQDD